MSHFSSAAGTGISLLTLRLQWSFLNADLTHQALGQQEQGRLQGHICFTHTSQVLFSHSFSHLLPSLFWCNMHQKSLRRHFRASLSSSPWAAMESCHCFLSLRGSVTHHVCKYGRVSSILSLFPHQIGVLVLTAISIRIANSISLALK